MPTGCHATIIRRLAASAAVAAAKEVTPGSRFSSGTRHRSRRMSPNCFLPPASLIRSIAPPHPTDSSTCSLLSQVRYGNPGLSNILINPG
eukprot:6066391-Pyramimonas_sp.AAC.1